MFTVVAVFNIGIVLMSTIAPPSLLLVQAEDIHIICPDLSAIAFSLGGDSTVKSVSETIDGSDAALHEINSKGGVRGIHKVRCTAVNNTDSPTIAQMIRNQSYLTIVGWFTLEEQRDVTEPTLIEENILSLSNIASEPNFYDWHPNYVNMYSSKQLELFSYVSYLLGTLQLKRVCTFIVTYPEDDAGAALIQASIYELALVRAAFAALNMEPACHLDVPAGATAEQIGLLALTIGVDNPQAMIMIGYPGIEAASVLGVLWYTNLGLEDGFIMMGGQLWQSIALETFSALNITDMGSKIKIFAVTSQAAHNQLDSPYVVQFTNAAKALKGDDYTTSPYSSTGYYSMRLLIELLEMTGTLTRAGLRKQLYQNSIIRVNENTHGMFSETEDPNDVVLPIGKCNHGGRQTHIHILTPELEIQGLGPFFSMSSSKCLPDHTDLRRPVYLPTLVRSSSGTSSFTPFSQWVNFHAMVVNGSHGLVHTHRPAPEAVGYTYTSTSTRRQASGTEEPDAFAKAYSTVQNAKNVMAHLAPQVITVTGLPTTSSADGSTSPFIDPVPLVPELAVTGRNDILYFNPTLDQQLFALAQHIASIPPATGTSAVLLMHDSVSTGVSAVAAQAFYTLGLGDGPSSSRFSTLSSTSLSAGAGASFVIVLGIQTTAEAEALVPFLAAEPTVTLMLEYQEYTQHYDALVSHSSYSASIAARIQFASSFPALLANTTVLERNFHTYLGAGVAPSPLLQQGYVLGRVLTSILERMSAGTSSSEFLNTLLETSVVGIESAILFGPFLNITAETGGCSVGARVVHVQSPGAAADSGVTTFADCSVPYVYPVDDILEPGIIVLIAVLCLLFVVIIVLVMVFVVGQTAVRDISNAPKDASKPFAVMFTDIQASTSLWSRLPADMGPALDTHHQIIRKLIAKDKCYEVKTIGDAFLIVHSNPSVLVQLAKDLQEDFYNYDWGSTRFDDAYKEAELEAYETATANLAQGSAHEDVLATFAVAKPPTANDPHYDAKWNGLRVRIGIHYGSGEIQFDEVSKGYDYYGTVVNTASRVEACASGGQIIISGAVLAALEMEQQEKQKLRGEEADSLPSFHHKEVYSLGSVLLRGVDAGIELFQIHFRERRYKPVLDAIAPATAADTLDSDKEEGASDGESVTSYHSEQPVGKAWELEDLEVEEEQPPQYAVVVPGGGTGRVANV